MSATNEFKPLSYCIAFTWVFGIIAMGFSIVPAPLNEFAITFSVLAVASALSAVFLGAREFKKDISKPEQKK